MIYERLIEKMEDEVRIIDTPRRYTKREVENLIELALLEREIEILRDRNNDNRGVFYLKELEDKLANKQKLYRI